VSAQVPVLSPEHVVSGHGSIDRLPALVQDSGASRLLVICGATSFAASGAARILPVLQQHADIRTWDDHRPNPTLDDVLAGLHVAYDHRAEVIIGVGGGSTLDIAKVVAALHDPDQAPDRSDVARRLISQHVTGSRLVGLILAPTTSGSGAQATHFATIYLSGNKHSVVGSALLPDTVILDPALAMSGSAYQRACSGIDALAQAVESLWAVSADARSRSLAQSAIELILPSIISFVEHPDATNAEGMAKGSHLAGQAINHSRTTVPHALSYAITQIVGLPHGHAVAHTLPAVFERHIRAKHGFDSGVSRAEHEHTMGRLVDLFGGGDADAAVDRIEQLVHHLGLRDPQRSNHEEIANNLDALTSGVDAARSNNNPLRFTDEDLRAILCHGLS
jgi:alcohol dehydrogenase class IV